MYLWAWKPTKVDGVANADLAMARHMAELNLDLIDHSAASICARHSRKAGKSEWQVCEECNVAMVTIQNSLLKILQKIYFFVKCEDQTKTDIFDESVTFSSHSSCPIGILVINIVYFKWTCTIHILCTKMLWHRIVIK